MRWFTTSSEEFAVLSVAGNAQGIIAIGGVARGIIAVGGCASIGVISIGMNAVGSVAAFGMNAFAPISVSLCNGVGIYSLAGVNGWGAWSNAGTNSTGISSQGGVNNSASWLPALFVIVVLLVASSIVRGSRRARERDHEIALRRFLSSEQRAAERVRATLVAIRGDELELADGEVNVVATAAPQAIAAARELAESKKGFGFSVVATLARESDVVTVEGASNYREAPRTSAVAVIHCGALSEATEPESWLPESADEVQWVIAWTARLAAGASIVALIILATR